jgi:hypothetical protein
MSRHSIFRVQDQSDSVLMVQITVRTEYVNNSYVQAHINDKNICDVRCELCPKYKLVLQLSTLAILRERHFIVQ